MTTRRTIKFSLAMLTLFGLATGLTGCGGDEGGKTPDTATVQKPGTDAQGKVTYDINKEGAAPK